MEVAERETPVRAVPGNSEVFSGADNGREDSASFLGQNGGKLGEAHDAHDGHDGQRLTLVSDPLAILARSRPSAQSDESDLRTLCAKLSAEVEKLSRKIDRMSELPLATDTAPVLREVDARFEWLTKELSDRLVTIGNEIAEIKRQVGAKPDRSLEARRDRPLEAKRTR